jgi:hypothetical protein
MSSTHDLRHAFARALPSGARSEEQSAPPDPSSPPAEKDRPNPTGSSAGEEGFGADEEAGEEAGEEEIKNPRIKELSEEARRHRLNAKAEKERADQAEAELAALKESGDSGETVRALRIELAWVKANQARPEPFRDVEAAMKMVDLGAVQVDEAGAVTGLDEAMAYVAKKYPYMVDDSGSSAPTPRPTYDTPDTPSGRPNNGSREGGRETLSRANLELKFPALRRAR